MEPITLTTERLFLRAFTPADTEAAHAACQDPDIQRWTVVPSPYTRADAEFFTGVMVPNGWRDDTEYAFAVHVGADGPLAAAVGISARTPGTYEVGFWLAKEHRGRGYMTEAVLAAAHWAFTELRADRLEWRAEIGNEPSRAVAERVGFVLEGTQRSGLLNKGTRRDAWIGALLPSDLGLPNANPYLPARP
ncbi:GNAT family N-acetyltransferase [Streptomyces sp. NPDC050504]|uniref:GNAT family N-acetyltransferase n=1 Tax=Streptomyces sp. NPDC050504 TaxID=3365618 RepID=UPI0037A823AC